MNKLIYVSVLVVALSSLPTMIKAKMDELDLMVCLEKFYDHVDNLRVPEKIAKVAEIVQAQEPQSPSLSAILDKSPLDAKKIHINTYEELMDLQSAAMNSTRYDAFRDDDCIYEPLFKEYRIKLESELDNPKHAKVQKFKDHMKLCNEILNIYQL